MSMVHVCDACGKVIQHPHDQKMREFTLNTSYDYGTVLTNPTVERKEIHLCDNCFHALYLIAEGAKMPGQPEQPIGQTIKVKYLSDKIEKLDYIASKSDWIDCSSPRDMRRTSFPAAQLSKISVLFRPTTWGWWMKVIVETTINGISRPLLCVIPQSRLATAFVSSALWSTSLRSLLKP